MGYADGLGSPDLVALGGENGGSGPLGTSLEQLDRLIQDLSWVPCPITDVETLS